MFWLKSCNVFLLLFLFFFFFCHLRKGCNEKKKSKIHPVKIKNSSCWELSQQEVESKKCPWFLNNETCLATKVLTLKISNALGLVYPKLHNQILRCHRKTRTFLKIKWGKGLNVGWKYSWLHHIQCWGQL